MKSYGKLSLKGSVHFEEKMTNLLNDISNDIENSINPKNYTCVILIGGYGRGEGGVIKVENVEFPHNNLDFLIVSTNLDKTKYNKLQEDVNMIITKHCQRVNIDFDLSIITEFKLKNSDPLVITYDMKYGHKLIIGNASFLTKIKRFEMEHIPEWDIRNLMVNRGTLLTINDLILQKKYHTMKDIKTVIKHCIKAIIGYGDALLYYHGEYHYSYIEKQIRMKKQTKIDEKFKKMYDEAMSFRFEPNYQKYLALDLIQFQREVKKVLKSIHLECESMALNKKNIQWSNYFETALNSNSNSFGIKTLLKNIRNLLLPHCFIKELSLENKLRAKMLGMRGVLPLLFPYIAFEMHDNKSQKILNDFFKMKTSNNTTLKEAYLLFWGKYINNNFSLQEYGLKKGSS